ncbi:MAG TPA: hypothetical protein VE981_15360 [Planctomycetota bacterium]|nr:hypothetical protein [Planctomycetota bacterium]
MNRVTMLTAILLASCSHSPPGAGSWKDMNHEQRHEYMEKVVFPKMRAEFVAFDAKAFGDMKCVTCHGDGARDHTFKMPNPKLPPLPADETEFKKLQEKHPEVTAFMREKVAPGMASLVGEQPYNPVTREGFSCFRCHPLGKTRLP